MPVCGENKVNTSEDIIGSSWSKRNTKTNKNTACKTDCKTITKTNTIIIIPARTQSN